MQGLGREKLVEIQVSCQKSVPVMSVQWEKQEHKADHWVLHRFDLNFQ